MKKIKIIKYLILCISVIFFLLIIIWRIDRAFFHPFIPNFDDQIRNDVTTLKFSVPKDRESCEKIGGIWGKMGPRPVEECNIPTKDAGKECTAGKECEGACLADLSREQIREGMDGRLFKTNGRCSDMIKVMGCRAYVYQGWAKTVCAD